MPVLGSCDLQRYLPRRWPTRQVCIGGVSVGGDAPIVVQSMTTTPTQDVTATVEQCRRLAAVGCQAIRITAPTVKDALALATIRQAFSADGFTDIPLIADIHFMPAAAMEAALHVEKVRINPGNYADRKHFKVIEYSDEAYAAELERLHERFSPLVRRCRELGRSMRIGVNHGSLSDRILNRYGDTPEGMVASAMEFVHICEDQDYRDLIISMKSSNPKVMVQAYRALVRALEAHGTHYPLHLGVTEAGDGEDGRVKGAAGIGSLLADGIGDTVRVSLTEEPEAEIPMARDLISICRLPTVTVERRVAFGSPPSDPTDPLRFHRRVAEIVRPAGAEGPALGGGQVPAVCVPRRLPAVGNTHEPGPDLLIDEDPPQVDGIILERSPCPWPAIVAEAAPTTAPLVWLQLPEYSPAAALVDQLREVDDSQMVALTDAGPWGLISGYRLLHAVIEEAFRQAEAEKPGSGCRQAICLVDRRRDLLAVATTIGSLLIDGIGDAVYLPGLPAPMQQSYTILQAVKVRQTRADYVACPSCGRTLFDLMTVTDHIREATAHLSDVTIAIMGCIVNGPGEMADADYGYVGSGPGVITLYKGRTPVRRNIPMIDARDALIDLIKEHGQWRDPPSAG